jgi:hypothetical protein
MLDGRYHVFMALTDAQAPDSIAVKVNFDKFVGASASQLEVDSALNDAKKHLAGIFVGVFALTGPADGSLDGFFQLGRLAREWCALVETHYYIGAEPILDFGCDLRA